MNWEEKFLVYTWNTCLHLRHLTSRVSARLSYFYRKGYWCNVFLLNQAKLQNASSYCCKKQKKSRELVLTCSGNAHLNSTRHAVLLLSLIGWGEVCFDTPVIHSSWHLPTYVRLLTDFYTAKVLRLMGSSSLKNSPTFSQQTHISAPTRCNSSHRITRWDRAKQRKRLVMAFRINFLSFKCPYRIYTIDIIHCTCWDLPLLL